jgi:hypothetical protein
LREVIAAYQRAVTEIVAGLDRTLPTFERKPLM